MRQVISWIRLLRHLPEVTRIKVVDVRPEDIVFLLCDRDLSLEAVDHIGRRFKQVTGLQRTVVVSGAADIGVIREADALARP